MILQIAKLNSYWVQTVCNGGGGGGGLGACLAGRQTTLQGMKDTLTRLFILPSEILLFSMKVGLYIAAVPFLRNAHTAIETISCDKLREIFVIV